MMRSRHDLVTQILAWKMESFVQASSPVRTICDIINNSPICNVHWTILAIVADKFLPGERSFWMSPRFLAAVHWHSLAQKTLMKFPMGLLFSRIGT